MRRLTTSVILSCLLAGCGGGPASAPPGAGLALGTGPDAAPTAPPSYSPYNPALGASDAKAGISDAGIKLLGGSLVVEATDGTRPVTQAVVDVYGQTLATGVGDATGKVTMGPLAAASGYTVIVRAPGFATLRQPDLEIKQKMTTSVRLALIPGATLGGRVSAAGQPVAGAVVSDGINSTLTDAEGRYVLEGVVPGQATLRVSKPRFQASVRAWAGAAGAVDGLDFELAATGASLFFDTRAASGLNPARYAGLKQALTGLGWTLVETPPPSPGDAWVLVCPAESPSPETIAQASAFVAQGGKLILLGEWGGYGGFDNLGANALAHGLGLHFNPDLIREAGGRSPEWLSIKRFEPLVFGTDGPKAAQLFNACSLYGLSGMRALASTGAQAYRIQSGEAASRPVAMGGPYGAGKAIALGDTSAFSDDDMDGDGTPDYKNADNLRFWEKLLAW
jgi:hypothetical protein